MLVRQSLSNSWIEINPSKIKAILDMPSPKSEKEIRGFLGLLQYISQFITKLASTCEPIFKLLRKNEPLHGMMSVKKPSSSLKNTFSIHLSQYS